MNNQHFLQQVGGGCLALGMVLGGGAIAALEGDLALLDLEPTPSLPVALDSKIRIALTDLFPPF